MHNRGQADESLVFRLTPDGQGEDLSTHMLMALGSVPDYDVENGETVAFDYVDLEALDRLFDNVIEKPRLGRVTFPFDQYQITVTADGEVTIRRAQIASE